MSIQFAKKNILRRCSSVKRKGLLLFMLIIGFTVVLISISAYLRLQNRSLGDCYNLKVTVVYPLNDLPISNVEIEVLSTIDHVITHQVADAEGQATFRLNSGEYIIHITSGYTGQLKVKLSSDQAVKLEVLPILR